MAVTIDSQKSTVLLCIPVPEFAGVARHFVDIATNGMPDFNLVFVSPEGDVTEHLEKLGVNVIPADFGVEAGITQSCKTLDALINQYKPEIVHTHLAYADIIASIVVNSRKLHHAINHKIWVPKTISTEHGIAVDDLVYHGSKAKVKLMETVHRLRLKFTDGKLAVSQFNAVQMKKKWGATGVEVIPNGVDLDIVVDKVKANRVEGEPGVLRVVSMARLAPEKKIDVLIDAFALVLKELPNAQLEIAGKGECKDDLIAQVKKLGIEKNVNFSGFNDPFEVMGRNDALVQLSIAENNSYTLLEAKAAGLKVLATAMGGNPEQLEPEEMVPALTASNRELIVSEAAKKIIKMADTDYIIPEDFTWSTTKEMTERIANKYARVIHS